MYFLKQCRYSGSVMALAATLVALPCPAQNGAMPPSIAGGSYNLADFGSLSTTEQADATLDAALKAVREKGGGVLIIPFDAPDGWMPRSGAQETVRTPPAPAPATTWSIGPGVTVMDARRSSLLVPQFTGMTVQRLFRLPEGDSAPHWLYLPMVHMKSNFVRGTSDYSGVLTAPVNAGKARKFYVDSTRGIFPGQVLEARTDEKSAAQPVTVTSLGFDTATKKTYFVADTARALPAGASLARHDKATAILERTNANNELQTFDINMTRHHYSQGDSYLINGSFYYMGNANSPMTRRAPSDDLDATGFGSGIYSARTINEVNIFRGAVASANPTRNEVVYERAANAHTLATGRPLINMNPKKWVTAGRACVNNPGGAILNWGGSVWSKDAPWSRELIGRFFALDEPTEYVPGTDVRRWYLITGYAEKDGIKRLTTQRFWWGAKNEGVGMSQLYDGKNYTGDEKNPVLLKYVIAPGANVYDVAEGAGTSSVQSNGARKRLIRVAPYTSSGTPFDFQQGDAIEQAIGPEPAAPITFRSWSWDRVPGVFPAPIFDIANNGVSPRNAMDISGKGGYGVVLNVQTDVNYGINITADVKKGVILFRQKENNAQYIDWNEAGDAKLGVDPQTGRFNYTGPIRLGGNGATGLKSLGKPGKSDSSNFRGINIPVPQDATSHEIKFDVPEADAAYAVKVQPSWPTDKAVSKTATGFTLQFSNAAPAGAKLDWLLIR